MLKRMFRTDVYAGVLVVLLLAKFLYPLLRFDVPLGYDVGMYRYLFLQYGSGELLPWAQEYPKALYVPLSLLVRMGLPVDMLIGWMWNLVPVALACTLAWVTAKRSNTATGVTVLLIALLSQPYFDGFYAMYMKVYVSLLFVVLTYHFADRMNPVFVLTALLAVLLHQQTGLILVLSLGVWWALQFRTQYNMRRYQLLSGALIACAAIALLVYLPQWERAIWSPLKSIVLLRGENAPAGTFPEASFYFRTMSVVLLLGIGGFLQSFLKERGSLWQLSVVFCLMFIVLQLVFYRRFYLLLDFFLMPYAAAMLVLLWKSCTKSLFYRGVLIVLLLAQLAIAFSIFSSRTPLIPRSGIVQIEAIRAHLPEDASVIALENISGPWLRGWIPDRQVGAPGLFDYPNWNKGDWQQFIDGTQAERRKLLQTLEGDVYFYISPAFTQLYGVRVQNVLEDPCLKKVDAQPLLLSVCSRDQ